MERISVSSLGDHKKPCRSFFIIAEWVATCQCSLSNIMLFCYVLCPICHGVVVAVRVVLERQ